MTKKAGKSVLDASIKRLLSAKNHHVRMVSRGRSLAGMIAAIIGVLNMFPFSVYAAAAITQPSSLEEKILNVFIIAIVFGALPYFLTKFVLRHITVSLRLWTWIVSSLIFFSIFVIIFITAISIENHFRPTHSFAQAKPVIYLYPTKEQEVHVELDYHGKLTATYPAYSPIQKGWRVIAHPDGHLTNMADDQPYSYLFWEGTPDAMRHDLSTGFVIAGKDTAGFLQQALKDFGLTPREYNEFIVYWLPKMENNPYNLIHFAGREYTDTAPLTITPKPDSMLRVFMEFKSLAEPIQIPEQKIEPFKRTGFAVIEWGGTELKQDIVRAY